MLHNLGLIKDIFNVLNFFRLFAVNLVYICILFYQEAHVPEPESCPVHVELYGVLFSATTAGTELDKYSGLVELQHRIRFPYREILDQQEKPYKLRRIQGKVRKLILSISRTIFLVS